MTREEMLVLLKEMKQNTINGTVYNDPKRESKSIALDMAIKALEQEPILDRLKVDIENEIRFWQEPSKYGNADKRVREAKVSSYKHMLELIDNLLAESEVTE